MAARFIGSVSVAWLQHAGDDRDMKLNQDFSFEDASGLRWKTPKGAVVNGASIPRVFWTIFGSPFIGDYRRASVVHDYFCQVRTRPSEATHRMFFEACVAGGVGQPKAKVMYAAVRTFGPSWRTLSGDLSLNGVVILEAGEEITILHTMDEQDFAAMAKWIEENDPPLDEIDAEIDQRAQEMPVLPAAPERPAASHF
jgi:hypothetical protein